MSDDVHQYSLPRGIAAGPISGNVVSGNIPREFIFQIFPKWEFLYKLTEIVQNIATFRYILLY